MEDNRQDDVEITGVVYALADTHVETLREQSHSGDNPGDVTNTNFFVKTCKLN